MQTLINGLLIGGTYIAISLGFSLSFGVMDIVDFATGEWVMVGAFTAFFLQRVTGWETLSLMPFSFAMAFAGGFLLHPLISRVTSGRRPRPVLMGLVFTFGVATLLRGAALTAFGFDFRSIQTQYDGSIELFGTIPTLRLIAFLTAIGLTVAAMVLLYHTRTGMAIRATAQDKVNAALQGVDIRRLTRLVYASHTGLSGMAGVLLGALFSVWAEMGVRYTIFAFFVVVLAGMGYLPGIIFASLALGVLQAFVATYWGAQYTLLLLFGALYLTLLVAPRGLFGKGV